MSAATPFPDPVPATLICGMSHTICIRRALPADLTDRVEVINLRADRRKLHPITRLPRRRALGIREPEIVAFLLGGNGHNILGLVEHTTPYAVIGPGWSDGDLDSREIVPAMALREVLAERLAPMAHIPAALREMFPGARQVIVNPPPPLSNRDAILANPRLFGDRIDRGLAPDALRVAVHRVQSDIFRDLARRLGADFLTAPDRLLTPSGMLAEPWCGIDATHGNTDYGREMLALILDTGNRVPCPKPPADTPIRDFPIDSSGVPTLVSRIRDLSTRLRSRRSASG